MIFELFASVGLGMVPLLSYLVKASTFSMKSVLFKVSELDLSALIEDLWSQMKMFKNSHKFPLEFC